jgi:hypothetical protein
MPSTCSPRTLAAGEGFDPYEKMLKMDASAVQREAVARKLCAMLTVHMQH